MDANGNDVTVDDRCMKKFFDYLTGKAVAKGDKGDTCADGKDGAN